MTSSYPYTPTTLRTNVKPRPWVPFKSYEGHVEVPPCPSSPGQGGRSQEKGITLFLVHGASFPKEICETNLCYLLAACGVIDEIWSWESVQHGDSAAKQTESQW
ncbi:uncharacterized protein BJ212DRAFT_1591677 [Suillus subaureus]|uniref:AB hydrolase-1 domain-containing protein n=1 Tax=Suillus subaureus TaxID=48587 RepID=A0A9P7DNB9_9AGAM|nr:uncharacterized protein BJ212DRAFT_1591677 [Suillus subaureus]KAG1799189.1 hypothetical protein BJ212DRAFT_1591677 [Suillus subaureus]